MWNWSFFILILCFCRSVNASVTNDRDIENAMALKQKKIGMIGGVSWESTVLYYKLINQTVREYLGGLNSAEILLYSLNYDPIVELERQEKWDDVGDELCQVAKTLQDGGADFIILCCNTLHKMTPAIEKGITIPFLHIADAAGNVLASKNIRKIGLLGTQFTMEDGFYSSRLKSKFGLEVIVPNESDRKKLDAIIYNELCQGKILPISKEILIQMINDLNREGAEVVLLGCTELGMLVNQDDVGTPIYDTTLLHAKEAADRSVK
jgi:aspartate racemase